MTNETEERRPIEILLVEDNPADVRLTEEAFRDNKILNRLNVVGDGVEAMAYLNGTGAYQGRNMPDIVLLDLNLPRKDGREVLREMKNDDELKKIPVVVLTTSRAEEDILRSYELHANCYVTKPVDFQQFADVVRSIEHFWFKVVKLP
jgi:chemotaxis family two-component system response regulator Rcp1